MFCNEVFNVIDFLHSHTSSLSLAHSHSFILSHGHAFLFCSISRNVEIALKLEEWVNVPLSEPMDNERSVLGCWKGQVRQGQVSFIPMHTYITNNLFLSILLRLELELMSDLI